MSTLSSTAAGNTSHGEEESVHKLANLAFDVLPVLFLTLMMISGVMCKFLITRYWPALPHTALEFVMGVIIGTANEANISAYGENSNVLFKSVRQWTRINPELFLLALLPALVFSDSFSQPFQTFKRAISQIIWLAVPGVLGGALLTAVLLFYTVPLFEDEMYLAITVGSILAATDPVAVVALLESVGGSPRLNVHIAGESMFNDGTAIVMFTIFSDLFFFQSDLDIGESVSFGDGIVIFLRQSLGGPLIGLAFSLGYHKVLWLLQLEENDGDTIMQLTMGVAVAYLAYFVAELAETSAVLSVVTLGICLGANSHPLIINPELFKGTWEALTSIATTIIFTLGGMLWGASLVADDRVGHVDWNDFGYLLLIYVYVVLVRAVIILLSYPLLRRTGLGTTWRDCLFMVWGGLRGSVGIALAVTLDLSIQETGTSDDKIRKKGSLIVFFVGGVSLLTLVVNGLTAGPLLRYLGLNKGSGSEEGEGEEQTAAIENEDTVKFGEDGDDTQAATENEATENDVSVQLETTAFEIESV